MQPEFIEWQGQHIPCRNKHEIYKTAETWLELNRCWLKETYGDGHLYLNAHTLEFVIGDSHNKCTEAYNRFFGSAFGVSQDILGADL